MSDALQQPLSDAELDQLEAMLATLPESMNLEMLDGFFAALLCSPQLVMPSEYLPVVLGDTADAFATQEMAETCLGLLLRHWNTIAQTLAANEVYDPILLADEDGQAQGNDWAIGFMEGVAMGEEAWKPLLLDEQHNELLIPMLILAHEHDPDPALRPDPIDEDTRMELFSALGGFLPEIHQFFADQRRKDVKDL